MAVSTTLSTPLSLVKDQLLSIAVGTSNIKCFNDSAFKENHYRTIPNDNSNEAQIRWANLPSVLQIGGDYAVAVSMFEYYPDYRDVLNQINDAQKSGAITSIPERGRMVIQNVPYTIDDNTRHIVFHKIVWVSATDLVLGSVAQQKAIADDEAAKQKAYIESLTTGTTPKLGNTDTPKASSTIWIILAVLLVLIGGIWALIAGKKKRDKVEAEKKGSGSNVNIIRIPKNT